MSVNYAILDGAPSVKIEEQHTVALLIMCLLKLFKAKAMMTVLIFGVSES